MAANKYLLIVITLFFLLSLISCFSNKNDKIIDVSSDQLYSRNININEYINDEIKLNCLNYKLIDEPCFENLEKYNSVLFRFSFINLYDTTIIASFTSYSNSWIKTLKFVPKSHFGIVPYILQQKKIKYNLEKYPIENFDSSYIKEMTQSLDTVANKISSVSSLLRIEIYENDIYLHRLTFDSIQINKFWNLIK